MPRIRLPWIAAALMAASPAFSQDLAHGYAGLAGGQSRTGHELVTNRQATIVDATIESSAFDATDTGWKAFAGWRFNDYLALEASYADLGRSRLVTNTVSVDLLPGSIDLRRKTTAFGLDAVVSAPVGTRFAVFGRAGAARARAQEVESLEGGIVFTNGPSGERERSATFDETVAHFGAGGEWRVRDNVSLRLEWERFHNVGKGSRLGDSGRTREADADLASVGVLMRF